ncbi:MULTISPECIES: FAD-binding protein [Aerococcus]|uniref:FAD-binding protein n=1 Tax=Aerococcus TaxID=1375 RepID=UPI000DCE3331|nr:FAD-binding protein [Aerococcus urinae]RAV71483.1 FAD-binding dehydrogenase [Aerococcus urinae]RAW05160.1 FAD-binding dehydrogenase [Aerococcus urinae]
MLVNEQTTYAAEYDVVVLGFGGAGATAARFASDAGAKVLLVDSAPNGHEGDNTRYCAQLIGSADNKEAMHKYYDELMAGMDLDDEVKSTYIEGLVNMEDYVRDYLDVEPYSIKDHFDKFPLESAVYEYPEFEGVETYNFLTVHEGIFDAALWKVLRQKVIDRSDSIDVWYESPAQSLLQDPSTRAIVGVQIDRQGQTVNIAAKNGVVLSVGGFENNPQMIKDYLNESRLAPLGGLYNQGHGVTMALEVGADLWHMANYESLGMYHGTAFDVPAGERATLHAFGTQPLTHGSILVIGDDGTRYFKEDEANRHGHIYNHGIWRVPQGQAKPYIIFDHKKYEELTQADGLFVDYAKAAVKANNLAELAQELDLDSEVLEATVKDFNHFAEAGKDYAFGRSADSMTAFDAEGPYYAIPIVQTMLNTQGGPRRNAKAEILDSHGQVIPNLYGAGELGGITPGMYQGGMNIAECLIFGKIAGENAAQEKENSISQLTGVPTTENKVNLQSDLDKGVATKDLQLKDNQYLGTSHSGMGDELNVVVTLDGDKLREITVLNHNESEQQGHEVFSELPQAMIAANSTDVDAISGATLSSNALKEAVADAIAKSKE